VRRPFPLSNVPPSPPILVEACVESPSEALDAELAGASRVELCASLGEGGITPSAGSIAVTVERLAIPVFVMVRPRGGDFTADDVELDTMVRDIEVAQLAGAAGIVAGVLTRERRVDREAMRAIVDVARPLPVTFHRAFDFTGNLDEALDDLLALGTARVLTSGGADTAMQGATRLASLRQRAGGALVVVAGGGVRADHATRLVSASGVVELHARPVRSIAAADGAPSTRAAGMAGARDLLDAEGIRALVRALA
jgi:copper homeostasis protein